MSEPTAEYLVLSRGKWDAAASKEEIETAIHVFYEWLAHHIDGCRMKEGSRLKRERAMVSKTGVSGDGPFSETKEVVGGYWFIVASSLDEAAGLAAQNPCIPYGLSFEIRPLESARASVYVVTNETPEPPPTAGESRGSA